MNPDFTWSRLESLNALELYEIIKARESVFVVEQNCSYQETDDLDPHAWHLSVLINGELAAYARVVDPGLKYEQPSIGRVMTLPQFRGLGIGKKLLDEAVAFTERSFPGLGIKIGAQIYLRGLYESFGFEAAGEPYDEDGIPHIDMIKQASDDTQKGVNVGQTNLECRGI